MPTEDIIVKIRTEVKDIKGLVNLRQDLVKLKRVGGATNKQIGAIDKRLGQVNKAGKGVANVMGQFKFELLGILFFGMADNKFLSGLIKPALEVTGVFEMMNDALTLLFLPTADKVSNVISDMTDKLSELSPTTQELIGDLVLLTSILFLGLFIFATFALGLASVQMAFGLTAGAAGLLFGSIILIGAVIIGLIILYKNWTKISDRLKVAIGATAIVLGIVLFAINPVAGAVALLIGAFILLRTGYDKLKAKFGTTTFFDTFKAALNVIIDKINDFLKLINMIPGIDIPGIPKFSVGSPEDVIGVSDELANIDSNIPRTNKPYKIGDSFFDITIHTTNGLDEVNLKDELLFFMNETNVRQTQNVSGNR